MRLARKKASSYWNFQKEIRSAAGNLRRIWRYVNSLLGENKQRSETCFTAEQYHGVIDKKTADIHAATESEESSSYSNNTTSAWPDLESVTVEDVHKAIDSSSTKQCDSDPLRTWWLKSCTTTIGPYITTLFNTSLSTGRFPATWKHVIVTPLLKKAGLDEFVPKNYRPVSNLPFLSKVLERIVHHQLISHLVRNDLQPDFPSAYQKGHSTETAVLKVFLNVVDGIEKGLFALLSLFDLTSAFDTVDHEILLRRMSITFGLTGISLRWFKSYLHDRTQSVQLNDVSTCPRRVSCSVPQGSVL